MIGRLSLSIMNQSMTAKNKFATPLKTPKAVAALSLAIALNSLPFKQII
jgi:hypothetical protein